VKFLITGYPRSGTKYTAKVLNKTSLDVGHEFKGKDGCVSWKHLPKALDFDLVLHQVRNPLKVIGSSHTINVTYLELDWDDLYNEDRILATQIMHKAKKYGYVI
jgi:hypothetical protein